MVYLINRSVSAQLLQLTGKAAFQRALIDISSRGKLPPSVAKSCTRPAETQRDGGRGWSKGGEGGGGELPPAPSSFLLFLVHQYVLYSIGAADL